MEKHKDFIILCGNIAIRIVAMIIFSGFLYNQLSVDDSIENPITVYVPLTVGCYFVYEGLVRLYEGFKIGKYSAFDISVAHILSFIFSDITMWGMASTFEHKILPIYNIVIVFAIQGIMTVIWAIFMNKIYLKLNIPNRILIIYGEKGTFNVIRKMECYKTRFQIIDVLDSSEKLSKILSMIDQSEGVLLNRVHEPIRGKIVQYCLKNNIRIYLVPDLSDIAVKSSKLIPLIDTPIFLYDNQKKNTHQLMVKRIFDFIISVFALIFLLPLLIAIAVLIKCEDGGPIFFLQERYTKENKMFKIIKFRSMSTDTKFVGAVPTLTEDPRVTKVGKFIRAYHIDELPQFINIIKGDMSIVGPRPERIENVQAYINEIPAFELRNKMRGGLTGIAQVYGKYNTSPYDKLCFDLLYIENWSLALDLKIILQTIKVCLEKKNCEGFSVNEVKHIYNITSRKGD